MGYLLDKIWGWLKKRYRADVRFQSGRLSMIQSASLTFGNYQITGVEVTSPDPFVMGISATQQITVDVTATRWIPPEDGVSSTEWSQEVFILDPVTAGVTYVSSDTGIATVNATGLITGVALGDTVVTVKAGGIEDVITVTINNSATVASVDVSPATASIGVSSTANVAAVVRNAGGQQLVGKTVTWASDASGVATVGSDSGTEAHTAIVTGVAEGTANIRATSETIQSSPSVITVTATTGTLYFADKFDSGDKSKTMGSARWITPSNCVVENTPGPFAGDNFVMLASYGPADINREQYFAIGTNVQGVFFGFYIKYPSNYIQSGSDYNKFLRVWSGRNVTGSGKYGYIDYNLKGGFSTAKTTTPGSTSRMRPEYGYRLASGSGSGVGDFILNISPAIIGTAAAPHETWLKVTGRLQVSSANGVSDGIIQLKINSTQVENSSVVDWYSRFPDPQILNYGYVLGAANSTFSVETPIRWTRFRLASTEALADPDNTTGW